MGGNNSHEQKGLDGSGSGASTPRGGSRRGGAPPSSEGQEKPPPSVSMVPVEKLGKLLVQHSQKEDGINGVTEKSFSKYLFPAYPELARRFFRSLQVSSQSAGAVPLAAFRAHAERVLALLDDALIIETYVKMFSIDAEEGVSQEDFRTLLYTCYKLSMDHYPEGPQTCLMIHKTLASVVRGCFGQNASHSAGFVVRWLQEHCRRLVLPLHRYCVHVLATKHRTIETQGERDGVGAGLELATPVLEHVGWQQTGAALLPASGAWLLAAAAPPLYSLPQQQNAAHTSSSSWLARLVCLVPVHWTPLYASRDHGLGANRFTHHVTQYRGPTVVIFEAAELVVAVCSPQEWRETHQYWGSADCALIQLQPQFSIIEKAPKMLYLNTSIRGYPRGLRAGSDTRTPALDVCEDFDRLSFRGTPHALRAVEVWGCGDQASRETQLQIKQWQVKEAERHRQVNVKLSAADWIEHPDRYLLELAGRPQYNNSAT